MSEKPKVEWSMVECDFCQQKVESINLEKITILKGKKSEFSGWACDECRMATPRHLSFNCQGKVMGVESEHELPSSLYELITLKMRGIN